MKPTPAELLEQVREAVKTEPVCEGYIHEDGLHVEGICDSKRIVINPQPSVVDSLIHETLHRLHPRWGHDRIYRETFRLFRVMTDRDVRSLYRTYQRRKRRLARTVNLSD